jgi:CRISPR-associated protein Cas2
MKHWLVIYDIRDSKRLAKISKKLSSYGTRVQKSVFEIEAPDTVINKLRFNIRKIMHSEDSVVYFDICEKDWQKRIKIGINLKENVDEEGFYII